MLFSPAGKRLLKLIVIVAALWALLYAGLLVWGKHRWEQTLMELVAKGETLNITDLAPPKVPDAENFFAAPFWQESQTSETAPASNYFSQLKGALGGNQGSPLPSVTASTAPYSQPVDLQLLANTWRKINKEPDRTEPAAQYVLSQLEPARAPLEALREATKRTGSQAFGDDRSPLNLAIQGRFSYLYARLAEKSLALRAIAESAIGQGAFSAQDLNTLLLTIDRFAREPAWSIQSARNNLIYSSTRGVWNGLYYNCWTNEQLESFQKTLSELPVRVPSIQAMRADRAEIAHLIESSANQGGFLAWIKAIQPDNPPEDPAIKLLLTLYPRGPMFEGLASFCLSTQQVIEAMQKTPIQSSNFPSLDHSCEITHHTFAPIHAKSVEYLSYFVGFAENSLIAETRARQASVACALELYHREHHAYPDALTDIPGLALDPFTGQPFLYQRPPSGGYILWSPGLDGKDDGGKPSDHRNVGDIMWSMPAERAAYAVAR